MTYDDQTPQHEKRIRGEVNYLRRLAKRIVHLYEKTAARGNVPQASYYLEEIDAVYWVMAEYQASTGFDVRNVLTTVDGHKNIRIERFDEILKKVTNLRGPVQITSDQLPPITHKASGE